MFFQDININKIWESFKRAVISIHGIIFYLPAFNAYLYNALEEMLEDNVQHGHNVMTFQISKKISQTLFLIYDFFLNITIIQAFFYALLVFRQNQRILVDKLAKTVKNPTKKLMKKKFG